MKSIDVEKDGNRICKLIGLERKLKQINEMIFNCMDYKRDTETEKIHPTEVFHSRSLKTLIEMFTDVGDVVIDPCAGSGVTLLAANI